MRAIPDIVLIVAMGATLVVLIVGILSFAVHGRFNARHANRLMTARVVLQGVAILALAAAVFTSLAP
ncbi:MAG: twin transmembrane helix small protein [Rhodobacterales bacterium]|nr:twin transmembrane helix small protein [Rhodobacterales bacterium]